MPDQPEMWSSLDSNSFRFCKHIASAAFYSQCITKMTSRLPQNVSGILFLSNTPPTGNRRQNIIPFGHWESARNTENVANLPVKAESEISLPPLKRQSSRGPFKGKLLKSLAHFLSRPLLLWGFLKNVLQNFSVLVRALLCLIQN